MKKILIESLAIKKQGTKVQFQIKLPRTCKKIIGLFATAIKESKSIIAVPNKNDYCGWLNLRIPNKRDVFFTELIQFANNKNEELGLLPKLNLGIGDDRERWFFGAKSQFLAMDIPIENTIIEGYFEDHSIADNSPYTVHVYLQLV